MVRRWERRIGCWLVSFAAEGSYFAAFVDEETALNLVRGKRRGYHG